MVPGVVEIKIRWEGVPGADSYEIWKDGVKVGSRGPKARTTSVQVDESTAIQIIDRPEGGVQSIGFTQAPGSA